MKLIEVPGIVEISSDGCFAKRLVGCNVNRSFVVERDLHAKMLPCKAKVERSVRWSTVVKCHSEGLDLASTTACKS